MWYKLQDDRIKLNIYIQPRTKKSKIAEIYGENLKDSHSSTANLLTQNPRNQSCF